MTVKGGLKKKFVCNKLTRSKVKHKLSELYEGNTAELKSLKLPKDKFDVAIKKKIVEEAKEIFEAKTKEEMIEEIADLYESLDAFMEHHEIDPEEVLDRQEAKKESHGEIGDEFATFLIINEDDPWHQYYSGNTHKYPIVIDEFDHQGKNLNVALSNDKAQPHIEIMLLDDDCNKLGSMFVANNSDEDFENNEFLSEQNSCEGCSCGFGGCSPKFDDLNEEDDCDDEEDGEIIILQSDLPDGVEEERILNALSRYFS